MEDWISIGYLLSAALFIFGLKKLGHPRTAPFGNQLGAMGMLVAVITTIVQMQFTGEGGSIFVGIVCFILHISYCYLGSLFLEFKNNNFIVATVEEDSEIELKMMKMRNFK